MSPTSLVTNRIAPDHIRDKPDSLWPKKVNALPVCHAGESGAKEHPVSLPSRRLAADYRCSALRGRRIRNATQETAIATNNATFASILNAGIPMSMPHSYGTSHTNQTPRLRR